MTIQCGDSECETEGVENEACLPISIPQGDPDFGGRQACLKFVRTQPVPETGCPTGNMPAKYLHE